AGPSTCDDGAAGNTCCGLFQKRESGNAGGSAGIRKGLRRLRISGVSVQRGKGRGNRRSESISEAQDDGGCRPFLCRKVFSDEPLSGCGLHGERRDQPETEAGKTHHPPFSADRAGVGNLAVRYAGIHVAVYRKYGEGRTSPIFSRISS